MWLNLLNWLGEQEKVVQAETNIHNDPDRIRKQIQKHKEFQRMLGAKQPAFDHVNRMGRHLRDRCPKPDIPVITDMLTQLKNRWNALCGSAVDRQRKLEEALLFSGQFKEALQALLDWLYKIEPTLREDLPLHGDIDTVNSLQEEHRAFQQELGRRTTSVATVRKAAMELMEKSDEDTSHWEPQLLDLTTKWEKICKLSVRKQERLDDAHKTASEFHDKTHGLLEWLAEAERQLRYQGNLPEEEEGLVKQLTEHQALCNEISKHEGALQECMTLGRDILARCHPDATTTVKHWLAVLQSRWDDVTAWARQRDEKLNNALKDLKDSEALINELMNWLHGAEANLLQQGSTPIPENIPIIEQLLHDHATFQTEIQVSKSWVSRCSY